MAGGAQGGRPAQNQGVGTQGAPQVTPQAQQFQQALQNYRQGAVGMPSQVPGANMAAPGGGMASAAVMPQAPQVSQVMPMAPQGQSVGASAPAVMPQMDQAQLQQIQAMANNPAYQQALLAAQQATMGGGNAAPTPMPMPRPTPQAQGQQTAMPMDARILPNGATVGRDDPRFYQGQNAGPAGVSPNWQRLQNMAAQYGQQGQVNPNDWRTGAAAAHQAEIMKSQLGAPQQDPRMQQNPRMTPRVSDMMPRRENLARPQIQGNPNAMPIQRGQGRVR